MTPHRWQDRAACLTADPALFFPERGASGAQAKAICAECPVRDQCLDDHLHEDYGIWGGTNERERSAIRRERGVRRRARVDLAPCGTAAAYRRHKRCGEPVDPACAEANRAAQRIVRDGKTAAA